MPSNLPAAVGSYKILKELGRSRWATVYLAHREHEDESQPVALKVMTASVLNGPEQLKRFRREARAAAKLKHPHLIRIYDPFPQQGEPFIAMEYIAGRTLRQKLNSGFLPPAEIICLIREIASALDYAHTHEIVHGAVKPENILLDSSRTLARPVLSDFATARLWLDALAQDGLSGQRSDLHQAHHYMAPEQWLGDSSLTPAVDIYALAIILFEILAGQPPFQANLPCHLREKHLNEPLPLLSQTLYSVGRFFDHFLTKAAAKNPADRYRSAAEFIQELEAVNAEAEYADQRVRRRRAKQALKLAHNYLKNQKHNLDQALVLAEEAIRINPGDREAQLLRGEIRLKQERFSEGLKDYQQAWEQETDSSSPAGLAYLNALKQTAEILWQRHLDVEAMKQYQTIHHLLTMDQMQGTDWQESWAELVKNHYDAGIRAYTLVDSTGGNLPDIIEAQKRVEREINALEMLQAGDKCEDLREKIRLLRIKYHYSTGDNAYASGNPEDLAQAMMVLEQEIGVLEMLGANVESGALQEKAKVLQVKEYQQITETELAALEAIQAQSGDSPPFYHNEAIFQHYPNLIHAYQKLGELEPHHQRWTELKEKAEQEYHYYQVRKLIDLGEYPQALHHLDRDFIRSGHYEYRDVATLLGRLVYAKQHEGVLPPEWTAAPVPVAVEPPQDEPAAGNQPHKLEKPFKFNFLVLLVQLFIIVISVIIGVVLEIIIRNLYF